MEGRPPPLGEARTRESTSLRISTRSIAPIRAKFRTWHRAIRKTITVDECLPAPLASVP